MTRDEKEALDNCRERNDYLEKFVEELGQTVKPLYTVTEILEDSVILSTGSGMVEAAKPAFAVKPGDIVSILSSTGAIVALSKATAGAAVVQVEEILPNGQALIVGEGGQKLVMSIAPGIQPIAGERVAVNGNLVTAVLKRQSQSRYLFDGDGNVEWTDIKGQDRAIGALREAIEWPRQYKDLYATFGKKPAKGILLWGPPGCGKTMLARAAATSLARAFGASSKGFFYIKGAELLDKYVGETESKIRDLFAATRVFQVENGHPPLLFIDEAEALLGQRGKGISSDVRDTIVPQMLSEMDGLDENGPIVLLATNRPDSLDTAVVRDGRVDHRIEVKRPSARDTEDLFGHYLKGLPVQGEDIAGRAASLLMTSRAGKNVSGAMVANVVNTAKGAAIRRFIDSPSTQAPCLEFADMRAAIDETAQSQELTS